jgi:alpha-L-rhamnosidase
MTNSNLKINGQNESVVVDQAPITLRWSLEHQQTECQIRISNDKEIVYSRVLLGKQCQFTINELEIEKHQEYRIEVMSHAADGTTTILYQCFRGGNRGQFNGQWISASNVLHNEADYYLPQPNTVIMKRMVINVLPEQALIHLIGLGYYDLYINKHRVSQYELNTDWTNYDKTICYDTHNIRPFLIEGDNEFVIELGNGWYNAAPLTLFGKYNLRSVLPTGEPKLLADIMFKQNDVWTAIASDDSWLVSQGNFLTNNLYLGEHFDFRHDDVADINWKKATYTDGPEGKLVPSYIPKIKRGRKVEWQQVYQLDENRILFDFGQTIAGFIDFTFSAVAGDTVVCRYAEELHADYSLNTDSTLAGFVGKQVEVDIVVPSGDGGPARAEQKDTITTKSGMQRFVNKFTFHSFRYIEIEGLSFDQIKSIKAIYVHTKLEAAGGFRCSDSRLNELYDAALVTKQNNLHSVFGDCARERLAYGGDIVALAKSQLYMFDSDTIYRKTVLDFINDRRENGGMPETAPFMGIKTNGTGEGAGPLAWQLVVIYLISLHYQHYGDEAFVRSVLPQIESQLDYLSRLDVEVIKQSCLGDWGSIAKQSDDYKSGSPARDFTSLCFYMYHFSLAVNLYNKLGDEERSIEHKRQVDRIKQLIVSNFSNSNGSFADGSQTSSVFALYFNLSDEPEKLLERWLSDVYNNGHCFTCGIYGQSFAYELAARLGIKQVIVDWLKCSSGVLHMLRDGNRALKEFFADNKNGSCNHAMFSSYASWFYQALGGIQIDDQAIGGDSLTIRPCFEADIEFVECWHQSNHGRIESHWTKTTRGIMLRINIPENIHRATLILDKEYHYSVNHLNVTNIDKNHIYIDVTNMSELTLVLK